MKHLLFVATATTVATLASCTSEVIPDRPELETVPSPIEFNTALGAMTRATGADAAEILHHHFNVYGIKWVPNDETTENPNGISEVFNDTKVSYKNGVWDYTSADEGMRFWDPNATKYNFFAYSDANAHKVIVAPATANVDAQVTIGSTSHNVDIEQLQHVYVAKGIMVQDNAFTSPVHFSFCNAAAKVRIAFYNAIPGYDIKIDNFYTSLNGQAAGNKSAVLHGSFIATSAYNVELNSAMTEMTTLIGTPTKQSSITLGTKCADVNIGRTVTDATFDKDGKGWTWVMPGNDQAADFKLKIDYRLISKHETINRTSEVTVPANFVHWYANHAYTYFFKITDNDLHPITFSAEVTDFQTNETITTIDSEQQADITTYVEGSDVQTDDQYLVGSTIYVGISNAGENPSVDVAFTTVEDIDGSNAATLIPEDDYKNLSSIVGSTFDKCYSFVAEETNGAGHYVIRVTYKCNVPEHTADHHAYKVVKVVAPGTDPTPTPTPDPTPNPNPGE